jgi:hypothetical protein
METDYPFGIFKFFFKQSAVCQIQYTGICFENNKIICFILHIPKYLSKIWQFEAISCITNFSLQEKLEDTIGVIRNHNMNTEKQYSG